MIFSDGRDELNIELTSDIHAFEQEAHIKEDAADAREAYSFDAEKSSIRKLYFAVDDEKLRKDLISKQIEIDQNLLAQRYAEVRDAQRKVSKAKQKEASNHWVFAAFIAVVVVAVGNFFFEISGTIGGAVAGAFLGIGYVEQSKRSAKFGLKFAENELVEADDTYESMRGAFIFSAYEETSLKPDEPLN